MKLHNTVAVVTGASSGLGRSFSKALISRGARVFGLARRSEKLQEVQDDLGERFHPVVGDVREAAQVERAFEDVQEAAGRIDVLINNAGLAQYGPVDELPLEQWDVQMDTNLRGVFLCTRAAAPVMKQQNAASGFGGHIVNIASIAGLVSNPEMSAYNASKSGVRGFSKAAMKELRADGIKVSCVYPGSTATHFSTVADRSGAPNPMQPEDVAATVLHLLASPDNYLISEVVMRPLRPRG